VFEKNGAEVLCDGLKRAGVQVVFGIPGVHNIFLFEALRRAKIRVVTATHEQSLALMANGYYRATGKPGVFVIVAGPGLTNAFTGIAEALLDSCAVVGIVTGKRTDRAKAIQIHEIDQVELVTPIAKRVFKITQAEKIAGQMFDAFQLAQADEPGPVILEIATNVYWERAGRATQPTPNKSAQSNADALARVVAQIQRAKQVGLFVGQGALDAADQVAQLAEWLNAPVATTVSGRGCLREDHPLAMDFRWSRRGIELMNQVLAQCDLVIAVGAKFSENGTAGYVLKFPDALIQVDTAAHVLGKNYPTLLALQMDARAFFAELIERKALFGPRQDFAIRHILQTCKAKSTTDDDVDAGIRFTVGAHTYSPREFFRALRAVLPMDAILVTDSGYNQFFAIEHFQSLAPRTLITPADYQSMGYCIPSAIGAAVACPDKNIVALVGDGGLTMGGLELLTAACEKIRLTTIVLNDGYFGFIKQVEEDLFGATSAVTLANPDFKKFAECLRARYASATDHLETTLRDCISSDAPVLLEVAVTYPQPDRLPQLRKRWRANLKQWATQSRAKLEHARVAMEHKFSRVNG
jgi:acetolactate synthase-1/2/3 large subunit